ncbi:PAS domain-containing sensor histidine kinase [Candidatus Curtissbacteria bacterium]|nr:PAS domain-containing sensor histidine kinase [Candidatus Curtissbacteria bacterium]
MDFASSQLLGLGVSVVAALVLLAAYFFVRKIVSQLRLASRREAELARKIYETEVMREIGDRIGYSLDGAKIVEIISGSLGKLLQYSTICYMIFPKGEKAKFACLVNETVGQSFVKDVKSKMAKASGNLTKIPLLEKDVDESLSGGLLDDDLDLAVKSYFELPVFIGEKLAGIISIASVRENLYDEENTAVLTRIAKHASAAATRFHEVLQNEKGKLAQAVQALSDGILMVNGDYELLLVNKKLSQLLGILEKPALFDIVNALSGSLDLRSLMEEALSSEGTMYAREIVVKEKVFQVGASKVLERNTDKPMGVLVVFHDVTDAKSLEKLRADFTSMMVHELRAPLTSIKSTVELLKSEVVKAEPSEIVKYLSTVDSTSQSMLEVVNDLLDVAKMESGRFDVICEKGNIDEPIRDRVEAYQALAGTKNLKLSVEIEKALPQGFFDKVRVKQVMNNLLSNAIKFTQSGDVKVKVYSGKENENVDSIVVSVSDSGIGIDSEEGRKLFSRFGQLVRSRRTAALKGSGLGLYIAKGIVEAWGGRIWYKSDGAGMGSTFYFTVPAVPPKPESQSSVGTNFVFSNVARA